MDTAAVVAFGLGSNQGDRLAFLREAVRRLRLVVDGLICSSSYESAALLPPAAPPEWNITYYNMVVAGHTSLTPQALLHTVKTIERDMGRIDRGRWGPREIDVDILLYGQCIVHEPGLDIPHIGLSERDFVLVPLAEILPDWVHPLIGKAVSAMAEGMETHLQRLEERID